jgi:hypothetical protein
MSGMKQQSVIREGMLFEHGAYTEPRRWVAAEDYERTIAEVTSLRSDLTACQLELGRLKGIAHGAYAALWDSSPAS